MDISEMKYLIGDISHFSSRHQVLYLLAGTGLSF